MGAKQVVRTNYHHGALRQALIDGAREILAERGFDQFSLNEVARRAGVSTAAPYRHFASKDELLAEVAELGYAALLQSLEEAEARTADVRERLLLLAGAYVRFAHDHPDLYATMFRDLGHAAEPMGSKSFGVLARTVADAQRAAIIPTSASNELMARSIWATLHGLAALNARQPHQRFGMDEVSETLAVDTLSALLGL
jgi:AcrR family transcriptional regulator